MTFIKIKRVRCIDTGGDKLLKKGWVYLVEEIEETSPGVYELQLPIVKHGTQVGSDWFPSHLFEVVSEEPEDTNSIRERRGWI